MGERSEYLGVWGGLRRGTIWIGRTQSLVGEKRRGGPKNRENVVFLDVFGVL